METSVAEARSRSRVLRLLLGKRVIATTAPSAELHLPRRNVRITLRILRVLERLLHPLHVVDTRKLSAQSLEYHF